MSMKLVPDTARSYVQRGVFLLALAVWQGYSYIVTGRTMMVLDTGAWHWPCWRGATSRPHAG